MENINKYLSEDADDEARAAAQRLEEGFAALRLQEKVRGAAAARARLQQQSRRRMLLGSVVILLMLLLGWWWTKEEVRIPENETPPQESTTPTVPPQQEEETELLQETPVQEEENVAPPTPPVRDLPIAQAPITPSLPPPPYGAPDTYLRGQAEQLAGKELLDQLWYTSYPLAGLTVDSVYKKVDKLLRERNFPLAYVNLQRLDRQLPPNDTLRYLQAYTLMEMGQGPEAIAAYEQMEKPAAAWAEQQQWYLAISLLLDEQTETALVIFKDIAAQPRHPYRQNAEKALKLYQ